MYITPIQISRYFPITFYMKLHITRCCMLLLVQSVCVMCYHHVEVACEILPASLRCSDNALTVPSRTVMNKSDVHIWLTVSKLQDRVVCQHLSYMQSDVSLLSRTILNNPLIVKDIRTISKLFIFICSLHSY